MRKTLFAFAALAALAARADVSVSALFASHMVMPRDRPAPVWGKAAPGEEVRVSFAGQELSAKADAAGDWQVELKPLKMSVEGRDLVVAGPSNTNVFTDVVIGDVWLCSGQSNMEMPMSWNVYEAARFKAESATLPGVRRLRMRKVQKPGPDHYEVPVEHSWAVASNALPNVTATGFFFARKVNLETGVPIGIVDNGWWASRIEPFIPYEGFKLVPALSQNYDKLRLHHPETAEGRAALEQCIAAARRWADAADAAVAAGTSVVRQPAQLPSDPNFSDKFNGVICPLTRFPIKGAIWYQGCANAGDGDIYADKMEALVLGWRKAWGYDFPFYYVQLASYNPAKTETAAGGTGFAFIRDVQRRAMRIPGTGMAVTIDVGNAKEIHAPCKLFVGERLALWALAKDYGKDVVFSGPLVKDAKAEKDATGNARVRVSFDYTGSGLMAGKKNNKDNSPVEEDLEAKGALKGFCLKDAGGEWHYAEAAIDGADVVVSSPEVKSPVAIRYAFRACPLGECSLYNKEGLPASPFNLVIAEGGKANP